MMIAFEEVADKDFKVDFSQDSWGFLGLQSSEVRRIVLMEMMVMFFATR